MEFNSEEDIRKMEPILLQKYVEELRLKDAINGRSANPAKTIASALTRITSLYNQAIRNERGPGWWVCGTYMSNQRKNVTCSIKGAYSEEKLGQFIEFCCCKNSEQIGSALSEAEVAKMIEALSALRPEACVHPPLSYWRTLIDE